MGKTKGFIEPKALRLNVHTFNCRHRADRRVEGLVAGWVGGGMGGGRRVQGMGGWVGFEFARRVRVLSSRAQGGSMGLALL